MALSAQMVWEVRPTNGSDNNGGGFKAGATGTDYSQQNAAQYALTSLTTAAANAIILTASASADMVGNTIQILSGTNFTLGIYEITAVSVGVSITVDRNCTTAAGASGTANVGGALQTLTKLAANMVGSNKAFVKAEATITTTAGFTFTAATVIPSETVPASRLFGYTTTRGDYGQVSITLSTNINLSALQFNGTGWIVDGFNINCSSLAGSTGIYFFGNNVTGSFEARNCKISNFTGGAGIYVTNYSASVHHCELTGGTSAAPAAIYFPTNGYYASICDNWIHDNVCPGITGLLEGSVVTGNTISNNTGASSDAIVTNMWDVYIVGNVLYKNGRHGIFLNKTTNGQFGSMYIRKNIITDHTTVGAAGLKCNTAALPADPRYDGNVYYNNTTNRVNMDGTSTNPVDGVSPYTNTLDILCTVSPFTNAAGNDFTLNNTANGGALVRGKMGPIGGTLYSGILGLTTLTGYADPGVYQHQDPAGGGGGSRVIGSSIILSGGLK